MEKAQLCYDRDDGLLKKYTDAAYQSYSSGGTGSPFNIGLMWYYMGKIYENDGYYATSGQVYEEDIQYLNASKAYRRAYIEKKERP